MLSNAPRLPDQLTKTEERALQEELRKRAYRHCDIVVKPWVECVKEEKLMSPVRCKDLQRRMEECIHSYDSEKGRKELTAEFIANRGKQNEGARKRKEEAEQKKQEQIRQIVAEERRRRKEAAMQAQANEGKDK